MRYVFGILFMMLFAGFLACTILLGQPPSAVLLYELRNISLGGALVCAALSAVVLGVLALGIGAKGKRISSGGVPVLCVLSALVNFGFGGYILRWLLTFKMSAFDFREGELVTSLKICTAAMFMLGLFSLGCLIVALISAKKHNSKLALTQ